MKRYKLLPLLLTAVATFLLNSCVIWDNPIDEPNDNNPIPGVGSIATEKADNFEVTFKFNDDVIVLDEEKMQYLSKIEEDNILYFSSNTPIDMIPKVGSIISARISDKTPYGLGNKVLEVTNEGGMIKCKTDVAALDEIFDDLELTSTTSLMNLIEGEITDEEGNPLKMNIETYQEESEEEGNSEEIAARRTTRAAIGSPEVLAITIPYKTDHGLFANMKLSIGVQLTANISLSNRTFELSREDFVGFGGTVGLSTKDYEKEMLKLLKCRLLNGVLAFGPVVLRPYIDLDSYLSVNASGTFETGFQKSASMRYGFTENGWFFKNTTNNGSQFFNKLSLNGRLGFGPTIKLDMGVGLYTNNVALELRPKVRAEVGGELDLSNENLYKLNPSAYLDVTAGVEGGFVAEIFNWELASFDVDFLNYNLLNLSWPLLPSYVESSLDVTKRSSSPLIFDGKYNVIGSALGKLLGVQPLLRVYKDNSLVYDVYNIMGASEMNVFAPHTMTYELSKLEKNVKYTAKPAFEVAGFKFEVGESVNFSDGDGELSCPDANHPHWIDLGLPSGTLWRCCNEGASTPEAYGGYFTFDQAQAYNPPSLDQLKELAKSGIRVWTTQNGVKGIRYKGPNGCMIFLPAAGYVRNGELVSVGSYGMYWSSTRLNEDEAERLEVHSLGLFWNYCDYRNYVQSVRPVR